MRRREKDGKDDSERWMISYADLLTLMLAFFVVLYSQSNLNVSRLKEIAKGMIVAFHGNPVVMMHSGHGGPGILKHHLSAIPRPVPTTLRHPDVAPTPKPAPHTTPHLGRKAARDLDLQTKALKKVAGQLKKILHPMIQRQMVKLAEQPLSLRIRLNSKILYKSGEARLEPSARKLLNKIAKVIKQIPNDYPVVIAGYTNRVPIHNKQFRSNWELSTARAVSVVHLLIKDHLPGGQLSAQGFSKYHPLIDNKSKKALRDNRRVEIVIRAPNASRLTTRKASLKQAQHEGNRAKPEQSGAHSSPRNTQSRPFAHSGHQGTRATVPHATPHQNPPAAAHTSGSHPSGHQGTHTAPHQSPPAAEPHAPGSHLPAATSSRDSNIQRSSRHGAKKQS